ncbi:hypothetical protein J1N10_06830 [Carboxylicivirga sp. A043]|uniref:hypothetical protein n=1 Tax=Carboxylicivirga litoralis TaxID=2816963 RepID=UPI0021CB9237|nr:hypothetical protein [Carboxylicivirga sp. A043]MCU4155686.1 hypothetical protein [Carboxylicivirga sp. A043]
MNDFNDIQNLWQAQDKQTLVSTEELKVKAKNHQQQALKKLLYTILILSTVCITLLVLWWLTPWGNAVSTGLSMMFSAILIRVSVELYCYRRMKNIDISEVSDRYQQKIKNFYRLRRVLVSVVTSTTLLLYIAGFLIMLPVFKATLPHWFFIYIVVFLSIGIPLSAYLLIRHARNELSELKRVIGLLE